MKMRTLAAAIVGFFLSIGSASAAIIYQSIPNLFSQNPIGQWCSTCNGNYTATAKFVLAQAAGIDGVTFGAYNNSYYTNNDYTIRVYNNNAGSIGTEIFSQTISSSDLSQGVTSPNGTTIFLTGALSGLSLNAGSYWMAFQGLPNGALSSFSAPGSYWIEQQYSQMNNQDLGFILTGGSGVPAPGALMLLGLGLLGLGAMRRKKAV